MERRLARVGLGAAGAVALCAALCAAWLGFVWPPPSWWNSHWPARTAFMAMRARQAPAAAAAAAYRPVPLDSMSRWLPRAAMVAEDDAFYLHHGIDWRALGEAVGYRRRRFDWRDSADRQELRRVLGAAADRRDRLRGASTITQQLAKNLYLSPSRNPLRKLKEAVIAYRLEWALSKQRILALYLNVAEFGPHLWGVEAASRRYFNRGALRLSLDQAALLAGTLPHPLTSNPGHRPGRARWRANLIVRRLRGEDVIVPKAQPEDTVRLKPVDALPVLPVDSLRVDSVAPDTGQVDTVPLPADTARRPPDSLPR